MGAITKTATIKAWLPSHSDLKAAHAADESADKLVAESGFSNFDMSTRGWVHIGSAQVSITLLGRDELTASHVAALRKEQAELVAKSTLIEGQIQSLLAIEHAEAT